MKQRKPTTTGLKNLRRRAEQRLVRAAPRAQPADPENAVRQLHELHVHQIELEMQNLELQRARADVEQALDSYTSLYDFAPIGYFTLTRDSTVARLNLTGATLLGATRSGLVGQRLADFVVSESRPLFAGFLERVFESRSLVILEVELRAADERPLFAHIEAVADEAGTTCRAMVVDITARRDAEQRADELLRQNRALTRRMFSVQESERRELARELHDELGQWLTAIQAEAEAIQGSAGAAQDPRLQVNAQAIRHNAGEVHRLLRQMLRRLRPSLLDSLGLAESLQELTAQWQQSHPHTALSLQLRGHLHPLGESLAITVYRIVQEALTNVARHAHARHVAIHLVAENPATGGAAALLLKVEDDGVGLDPASAPSGLGLLGMRERVIALDGEFSIHGAPRKGTQISVRLPLESPLQTVTSP